jgi:hypothetical protein
MCLHSLTSSSNERGVDRRLTGNLPVPETALEHRAEPEVRVSDPQGHASEKWIRFSARTMLSFKEKAPDPKVDLHFWVRCFSGMRS